MKKWNILHNYSNGDDISKVLLENRGITSQDDAAAFLSSPPMSEWVKTFPKEFKDALSRAAELIKDAIQTGRAIVIHGDYDADGITSTAILYETINRELGYKNSFYFIPNRFDHGYGLSKNSIDEVNNKYPGALVVTVDSGITSVEEVDYMKKLGFGVIITDHHQKPLHLPKADCIVWSDQMVAASISWVLSRVLGSKDTQNLGLAALATVTDLQPVLGFNRTVLKKGLEIINSNPPIGIRKLLEVAGRARAKITSYDLGWVIGPRLNASGRLVEAEESVLLLLEKDTKRAEELARKLNEVNVTRQNKTFEMFELAVSGKTVEPTSLPKIIFSAKEEYHEGIIGLVAAKLVQKHYRPAVVISLSDGYGKGSVRSVPGVNIIELLRNTEDLFESLGGHPMAAGFSIKTDRLDELEKRLLVLSEKIIKDEHLVRTLTVDLEIPTDLISLDLVEEISQLEPFGIGNEEPVFCVRGLGIAGMDIVGRDGQHLSLRLFDGKNFYKAIYFGGAFLTKEINMGDKIDLAFSVNKNVYKDKVSVDLVVKDVIKG
jgi:single-stranded-DNA-specific exonuclease